MEEFFNTITSGFHKEELPVPPSRMNVLVLAYIGDTVYDLFVRTYLVHHHNENAHGLHMRSIGIVKAGAQANTLEGIYEYLTEQEKAVYRRGRNAKPATVPKNAQLGDYHRATGFEAVLGYLYLEGDYARLLDVLKRTIDEWGKER
ncbi:ribonuclease III [Clostridia bacterium OttesenSCG-928-F22]|nr:ribonuclease III [Clostridia bacterium OttesenSCG-928-F22]